MTTDRSLVEWEAYPGAANDLDRMAEEAGGWVCSHHPELEFPHGDCAGPGMLRSEAVAAGMLPE